jgi:hypothetical protein
LAIEGLFAQERVAERRRGLIEVAHQVLLSLLQLNFVAAAEEALKEVALALEGPKSALHLPILRVMRSSEDSLSRPQLSFLRLEPRRLNRYLPIEVCLILSPLSSEPLQLSLVMLPQAA